MRNLDAKLIGVVSAVWTAFALTYWVLDLQTSAMTWGAGAAVFMIFAVSMGMAYKRAAPVDEPSAREAANLDAALIGVVSAVWLVFALTYGMLGMSISAVTWGAGAWLFILLTAGLVMARRRR